MFRGYVKDFFICSSDALFVRELKLDILSHISTEANVSSVLSELLAYCKDPNKEFVSKTIQAMGRVASALPSVADRCMRALMTLVTSPSEAVVAQAVIVIRQLLQKNYELHPGVIRSMVWGHTLSGSRFLSLSLFALSCSPAVCCVVRRNYWTP